MTKVVLDHATLAKLSGFVDSLEVCDPSGKTVGVFLPFHPGEPKLCDVTPMISEEERARRFNEPGGKTLAEIWKSLDAK